MADRPLTDLQRRVLRAMVELEKESRYPTILAEDVGSYLRLPRVRRRGRGAVKGSWSGSCAVGFSIASTMSSLVGRGLLLRYSSGRERHVYAYRLTKAGREAAR